MQQEPIEQILKKYFPGEKVKKKFQTKFISSNSTLVSNDITKNLNFSKEKQTYFSDKFPLPYNIIETSNYVIIDERRKINLFFRFFIGFLLTFVSLFILMLLVPISISTQEKLLASVVIALIYAPFMLISLIFDLNNRAVFYKKEIVKLEEAGKDITITIQVYRDENSKPRYIMHGIVPLKWIRYPLIKEINTFFPRIWRKQSPRYECVIKAEKI